MKTAFRLLALLSVFCVAIAIAQPAAPDPGAPPAVAPVSAGVTANNLVQWLTPVIVPLVIAGLKKLVPKIPVFILPIVAPLLGIAIDYVNTLATAHSSNFLAAAALGLAGVGVREIKDQLTPAKPDPLNP